MLRLSTDQTWAVVAADVLVGAPPSWRVNLYLVHLPSGWSRLVARGLDGGPSKEMPAMPALSDDGRVVAYLSSAADLVAEDTNGVSDAFTWQRPIVAPG